jgi:hypothetical protein
LEGRISDFANRHFWISSFYSRIHKDANVAGWMQIASPFEIGLLGGIGFSSMCYLLRVMIAQNMVTPYTMVALEASGGRLKDESVEQGMIGLVHYYMSLGFSYVRPQALFYEIFGNSVHGLADVPGPVEEYIRYQFKQQLALAVLMVATIGRILNKCPQSKQLIMPSPPRYGGNAESSCHRRLRSGGLSTRPCGKKERGCRSKQRARSSVSLNGL